MTLLLQYWKDLLFCDVNNMFDFYLEKDIEDIKEEVYNANGNKYVCCLSSL
jgi:hypothetical protein